jgi:hypothetical protein
MGGFCDAKENYVAVCGGARNGARWLLLFGDIGTCSDLYTHFMTLLLFTTVTHALDDPSPVIDTTCRGPVLVSLLQEGSLKSCPT